MIDREETGTTGGAAPTEDAGKPRRTLGDVSGAEGSSGASASFARRGSSPRGNAGKAKKGPGRPTKNAAGFPQSSIDEVVIDPEVEAARAEFEEVLTELLVSTTEGIAESRYILLKKSFPEAEARGLANKALLTDKERKYFSSVIVRIWRKYLGDQYLFSDEAIAGVYVFQYLLRNWTPMAEAKKIETEINDKKQPVVQSPQPVSAGGQASGQVNPSGAPDSNARG